MQRSHSLLFINLPPFCPFVLNHHERGHVSMDIRLFIFMFLCSSVCTLNRFKSVFRNPVCLRPQQEEEERSGGL